jgi:putative tryptophan/tyrosine transport system substrate-binding protein
MDRRSFLGILAGGLVTRPLGVEAGPPEKLHRIGMLERTSIATNAANVDGFRQGLRELGYVEGRSFVIEYRSADGRDDRFPGLAAELARLKVDLILSRGTPAALAAKKATGTIPVVFVGVGDPVAQGVVASLAHPGGNLTGMSAVVTEIYPKRVQLLRELVPRATRVAVLFNMSNPAQPPQWKAVETAARFLRIELHLLDVRQPADLKPAFDTARRQRADALIVGLDTSRRRTNESSSTSRRSTGCPRCMHPRSLPVAWSPTEWITARRIAARPASRTRSSRARIPPTSRSRSPPSWSWSSTSGPPRPSA